MMNYDHMLDYFHINLKYAPQNLAVINIMINVKKLN